MSGAVKPLGYEYADRFVVEGGRSCVKCGGSVSHVSRGRGAEPYCRRCGFQKGPRGGAR